MDWETLIADIIERGHDLRPSCYRAHVPGEGYTNDGNRIDRVADYMRQYRQALKSEAENMGSALKYAEPGYGPAPKNGILFANWNVFPEAVSDWLEAEGYALEWSDEWSTCDDCGSAFRTCADSYAWSPAGGYDEIAGADRCNVCRADDAPEDDDDDDQEGARS